MECIKFYLYKLGNLHPELVCVLGAEKRGSARFYVSGHTEHENKCTRRLLSLAGAQSLAGAFQYLKQLMAYVIVPRALQQV